MMNLPFRVLRSAASLLLASCAGDLLVGEKRCFGDGVDCSPDVPTLYPYGEGFQSSSFELIASRSVAPVWTYDQPSPGLTQLALALGGGVWALRLAAPTSELQRFNAAGEPVESHELETLRELSVDEELRPVVLFWSQVTGMVAPEPDAVVFAVSQSDAGGDRAIARLARVEFEP